MSDKRGIYLVANYKSQEMCANLIYSIRQSGCTLPIRLIHFGGEKIDSPYIISQVESQYYENFPDEAKQLVRSILSVLPNYSPGLVYRYLAWFSDWDEFIYSDNDVVALNNWDKLFGYLQEYDFVHADKEYITNGMFDYFKPEKLKTIFGENCLESALTSGHIVVKKNNQMIQDIYKAVEWFQQYPDVPKRNDQSFMHVSCMVGNWKKLNLCQPPYNWLSPWAGDYKNLLELIQKVQIAGNEISHLHYSGSNPKGDKAIQELLFSINDDKKRLMQLSFIGIRSISGYYDLIRQYLRVKRFVNRKFMKN